jgi:16S rRNA (cytidine1402-2'-O)-methyltransferase
LARVVATPHTAVLFEAPGRLRRLLTDLIERGGGERPAAVARELTKMHEQFVRGTLAEAAAYYEGGTIRGEIVVVLGPPVVAGSSVATADKASAAALAADLIAEGSRPSAAARELARLLGISRNEAYEIVLAVTAGEGEVH